MSAPTVAVAIGHMPQAQRNSGMRPVSSTVTGSGLPMETKSLPDGLVVAPLESVTWLDTSASPAPTRSRVDAPVDWSIWRTVPTETLLFIMLPTPWGTPETDAS